MDEEADVTFNPAAAQSILQILEQVELPDQDLAIDFGSQRYTAQRIFDANTIVEFYRLNGFKSYCSLDVNDAPLNIKCDLNEMVSPYLVYNKQASLITNIGTGEHIFDQCSVFTNMHNLCKVGGVMFFHLPFTPWLNHGFYNFNPILFPALAYANKYNMLMLNIGDREGRITHIPYDELVKEKGQVMLEQAAKGATMPLFVYCAFQKKFDQSFKKPFQGKYKADIKDENIVKRYL